MIDWLRSITLDTGGETVTAIIAVIISLGALFHSSKSSKAAERSAKAAEEANEHSRKAAAAAEENARVAAELETKRCKMNAYWALRRMHGQLPRDSPDWDMSAIQDLLVLHRHHLTSRVHQAVETVLDSLSDLKARADYLTQDDVDLMEKVFNDIWDACNALKDDLDRSTENR